MVHLDLGCSTAFICFVNFEFYSLLDFRLIQIMLYFCLFFFFLILSVCLEDYNKYYNIMIIPII